MPLPPDAAVPLPLKLPDIFGNVLESVIVGAEAVKKILVPAPLTKEALYGGPDAVTYEPGTGEIE